MHHRFAKWPTALPTTGPNGKYILLPRRDVGLSLSRSIGDRLFKESNAVRHVRAMDGWMDGWVDGWMDGWMGGWMDWWMDGWIGGWMDGWVDGWMDR
jgi:hypothetical protein